MSADAKALLDSLMGPARDKSREENLKADGWKENNVCKRYLVGFCPNNAQDNWFHNTRRKDLNECRKIHSDKLRDDFLTHTEKVKYEPEYEQEFLDFLEGLVREADAWIARENSNAKLTVKRDKTPAHVKEKLAKLKMQSDVLFKRAEEAADASDLAGSKSAVDLANIVKQEIDELKAEYQDGKEKEETSMAIVCDVCGVRCNPDEKADFEAHLAGRLHGGYTQIRDKVKELREKFKARHSKREAEKKEKEQDGGKDKSEEAEKSRKADKKAERKDGDRERKEKEKERDKKSRSPKRSRGRDRGRDRDRDRDRSRSRRRRR